MGEAINLVNNFKVDKVIFNCGPYNDLEKELIKVLDKKKIKYYSCIKELDIDRNKLYFLQTNEYDNENDNINVIYTELNGYKFMFMGDASITTKKEILSKYNLPDINVLKVGHRGSKTSSCKKLKTNDKKDISKYITDITYEDEKGWISLFTGSFKCFINRIENNKFVLEFSCEAKECGEYYKLLLGEEIEINIE